MAEGLPAVVCSFLLSTCSESPAPMVPSDSAWLFCPEAEVSLLALANELMRRQR